MIQQKETSRSSSTKIRRGKHEQHMTDAKSEFSIEIEQDSHNQGDHRPSSFIWFIGIKRIVLGTLSQTRK
jgi:hypothetical protein